MWSETDIRDLFSRNVRKLRKARDLTIAELAKRCEVDRKTAWRWENEGLIPQPHTMVKLGEVLGYDNPYTLLTHEVGFMVTFTKKHK